MSLSLSLRLTLTGVAASDDEDAGAAGGAQEAAEQRRQGLVALVPVEGGLLLAVALVPVPLLAVRLRLRHSPLNLIHQFVSDF